MTRRAFLSGAPRTDVVFEEKGIALDPNTPWCKSVKVGGEAKDQEFTATIADADGKVFLAYTPDRPDPHDPLPPKVENPKEPKEYASAELAYEVGLRLAPTGSSGPRTCSGGARGGGGGARRFPDVRVFRKGH